MFDFALSFLVSAENNLYAPEVAWVLGLLILQAKDFVMICRLPPARRRRDGRRKRPRPQTVYRRLRKYWSARVMATMQIFSDFRGSGVYRCHGIERFKIKRYRKTENTRCAVG